VVGARPWALPLVALAWGFAEATLFVVVPDVLLTFATAKWGLRAVMPASLAAAVGALAGGALMHAWGGHDLPGAAAALERLPAIGDAMIARAGEAMRGPAWSFAMVAGAFEGTPYKIFATQAGAAHLPLAEFLAMSAVARLSRFWTTMAMAELAARAARAARAGPHAALAAVAVLWAIFYALYWWSMPG
jgi:membrane protein YqaA with SNARE-associated domain